MNSYRIESEAGVDMGIYQGETEQEALDAMARDAGYKSVADADSQGFGGTCTATLVSGE